MNYELSNVENEERTMNCDLWRRNYKLWSLKYAVWSHLAHPGYFENPISLKSVLGERGRGRGGGRGGVCSLENYNDAQSNRVSDFRDFVCSLFSNAIIFYFYFKLKLWSRRYSFWTCEVRVWIANYEVRIVEQEFWIENCIQEWIWNAK